MCDDTMAPTPVPMATAVEVRFVPDDVDARPSVQETMSEMAGLPPSVVKELLPILKGVSSSCFFMHAALGFRFLSGKETRTAESERFYTLNAHYCFNLSSASLPTCFTCDLF